MLRKLEIDSDLKYDSNTSFDFEENFNVLQYSSFRTTSISIFTSWGNLESDYDVEQDCIIENSRENRVKIQRFLTKEGWQRVSQIEGCISELMDDIGGVDYTNIDELTDVLDEIGISYTSNYLRMSTRGYSQGDYAEILINTADYKKEIGHDFFEADYQKWFDHYFWDSQIFGTINIAFEYTRNGVNVEYDDEFEFSEWTEDPYDMDGLNCEPIAIWIRENVAYPLTDDEVAQIMTELEKLDYTDVSYQCGC